MLYLCDGYHAHPKYLLAFFADSGESEEDTCPHPGSIEVASLPHSELRMNMMNAAAAPSPFSAPKTLVAGKKKRPTLVEYSGCC